MDNNKGITLTSLIIYIIGLTFVIAIVASLTSFFSENINVDDSYTDSTTQYTKLISLISDEVNTKQNKVLGCKTYTESDGTKTSYIFFSSGNQYTYKESTKAIYQNNVKTCQNIDICIFTYEETLSNYEIKIDFKSGKINKIGENALTYTLKK